ncbi:MAG: thiamine pyrophosphate-dependent dehydrogenase E1 component subunit alpha [Candidatus Sungbacteria bacterium]|nr:thiamine pyrophosphate-dependent dehydrogenase E1 component subunit alpha [Candidatus Sungbacteria bacterium]
MVKHAVTKETSRKLYRQLYLIRTAENAIRAHYGENEMKMPMHMSIGAEAIAAGVCHALGERGQVFCTYRSHATYLAKTEETDDYFAELYGKVSGIARGKAGSMHLSSPEHGFLGASAIVASTIPVAVGVALACKRKKTKNMAAVFFGDGAIDEGVFWESWNIACLMKLPILFICEDNRLAVHTSGEERHGYRSIVNVLKQFTGNVFESRTTDVEEISAITKKAMRGYAEQEKPAFLRLHYYRYLEHVGVNEDFDQGYRSQKEFIQWQKRDPVLLQRKRLLGLGITEDAIKKEEGVTDKQIAESIERAKKAKFPDQKELFTNVFYEAR